MELLISDKVTIQTAFTLPGKAKAGGSIPLSNESLFLLQQSELNPIDIIIKGIPFHVIPESTLEQYRNESDGYFRLIYIQINILTSEYYIGKVNRPTLRGIKRYRGSGLKFRKKYAKHQGEFIRLFIAACDTAIQTEELEASIVDEELLSDPKCLNLVQGGAGTNVHPTSEETRQKLHTYMIDHPEQSQAMIVASRKAFSSGDTRELRERSKKIKETMSSEKYRKMTKERILNWIKENPEAYAESRKRNKEAQNNIQTKEKRNRSLKKWAEEHPDEYAMNQQHLRQAQQSPEAKQKRSSSLRQWAIEHPEAAEENRKKRALLASKKLSKPVNMLDLDTGEILHSFQCQHDAARWLVQQGITKNVNCVSSISSVCLKKSCKNGGYRKMAYGFGWEFAETEDTV